jgi:hypothetical protein
MKTVKTFLIILIAVIFVVSCSMSEKAMTPEDFLKIEVEYINSDQSVGAKEAIAKKYGYTLKGYTDFEEKVEKDPNLKKTLGELMLNQQKKGGKK